MLPGESVGFNALKVVMAVLVGEVEKVEVLVVVIDDDSVELLNTRAVGIREMVVADPIVVGGGSVDEFVVVVVSPCERRTPKITIPNVKVVTKHAPNATVSFRVLTLSKGRVMERWRSSDKKPNTKNCERATNQLKLDTV